MNGSAPRLVLLAGVPRAPEEVATTGTRIEPVAVAAGLALVLALAGLLSRRALRRAAR